MRIRNSVNIPPQPPSQSPPPHVMVSRINSRLSSIDNGSDSKDESSWSPMSTNESFGNSMFEQTSTSSNSVSSSLSYNGRWCEEEKAIPLKKRRVVMVKAETSKNKDPNERCNRVNGKGWRCNKLKVKGHSLCNHHLEMQRNRNSSISRNQGGEGETTSFGVENKRVKGVKKARSIRSLLRKTVPLVHY